MTFYHELQLVKVYLLAVPSGLSLSVSASSGGGAMCGGDADNSEADGNISGDLGGEGILVVFSESSVNGEAHVVDGDVSDGDTGGDTSKGDVDGDICGEGILVDVVHGIL